MVEERIVGDQKPTPSDVEALKKELASIKKEMMMKEFEDLKREKMRKELEELKAEQATGGSRNYYAPRKPQLSIVTTLMACLTLLVAGYMLGTVYWFNMAGEVEKYLLEFNLPISGFIALNVIAVVVALIGMGLVTVAKK